MRIKHTVKRAVPKSAKEWIEVAKRKMGVEKDSDIAKAMGTSKQTISNYMNGKNAIGAKEAIKLGWMIDEDPVEILIDAAVIASGENLEWVEMMNEYHKRKKERKG